jgi:hypothetical protein
MTNPSHLKHLITISSDNKFNMKFNIRNTNLIYSLPHFSTLARKISSIDIDRVISFIATADPNQLIN